MIFSHAIIITHFENTAPEAIVSTPDRPLPGQNPPPKVSLLPRVMEFSMTLCASGTRQDAMQWSDNDQNNIPQIFVLDSCTFL